MHAWSVVHDVLMCGLVWQVWPWVCGGRYLLGRHKGLWGERYL